MTSNPQQSEESWKKELEKVLPRIVKRGGYTIDNSATVDEVVDFISQQIEIARKAERERIKGEIEEHLNLTMDVYNTSKTQKDRELVGLVKIELLNSL